MATHEQRPQSNPSEPQIRADPDRLRRLDQRIQKNGSRSQGVSHDGFDPPTLNTGAAQQQGGVQAPLAAKGEQQHARPSSHSGSQERYDLAVVHGQPLGPSPSTGSGESDDIPRTKQPKRSSSTTSIPPVPLLGDPGGAAPATSSYSSAAPAASTTGSKSKRSSGSPTTRSRRRTGSRRPARKDSSSTAYVPSSTAYIKDMPLQACRQRVLFLESVSRGAITKEVKKYIESLSTESLRERLKELEEERESKVSKQEVELKDVREKYRPTIVKLIMAQAQQENRRARDQHLLNVQRLGWATAVRSGLTVHETWCDGSAFKSLYSRQRDIEARRKQLEDDKKRLQKLRPSRAKRRAADGRGSDEGRSSTRGSKDKPAKLSEEEYQERLEVISLNMSNLKSEEETLRTQLAALIRERNLHVREMKRISDEDSARFRGLPYRLHDNYVLMSLLGKGGFSEVYKAYDVTECRLVACKIHQLSASWSDAKKANYIKHATREYEIHRELKHPRVVELYDVFEIDQNSFCTVLEYCPGQDLDFLLKQEHRLSEREARNKIIQIMSALKYLNSVNPPIIHYDLKPANVLLTDGQVKLTDFGLSKQVKEIDESGNMDLTSQGAGTYWYLPPECFVVGKAPPKISSKVDVWSVGVIFYQCLYGEKPFGHNQSQQSILQNNVILNARDVKFPAKPRVTEEAKAFIRRCLTYSADERPDVRTLASDPYLLRKPPRMT